MSMDEIVSANEDTCLPHWGPLRRLIHRLCKNFRPVNALVALWHLRRGDEECLHVPLYMAICPTGRCNAGCLFCQGCSRDNFAGFSDIPIEALLRFLRPSAKALLQLGLEGNGEPTIARSFPALLQFLGEHRQISTYLITNGAALNKETILAMARTGIDTCNFSLNAASEKAYAQVMRLKHLDRSWANLALFAGHSSAAISVSFVVVRQNAHEALDFLLRARELPRLTDVYIHPLSEMGNAEGVVEDLRDIVPYEHEIQDVLDAMEEFQARHNSGSLRVCREPFKSFRSSTRLIEPYDLPGFMLPPWPKYWQAQGGAEVEWLPKGLRLRCGREGGRLVSAWIPAAPSVELRLRYATQGQGDLRLCLEDRQGDTLLQADLKKDEVSRGETELKFNSGPAGALRFVLSAEGPCSGEIFFPRFRTPPPFPSMPKELRLPSPRRWERGLPTLEARWRESRLSLSGESPRPLFYLLKSHSFPLPDLEPEQSEHNFTLEALIRRGAPVLGVLDAGRNCWLAQLPLRAGRQDYAFDPGQAERVCFILFNKVKGPLDLELDFGPLLEEGDNLTPAAEKPGEQPAEPPVVKPSRLYCMYPWMHLNNLGADGRVDICCIATGDSRKEYALGNLRSSSFQDMWNGEVMRAFRRAVNTPNPPPPCRSCTLNRLIPGKILWWQVWRPHPQALKSAWFRALRSVYRRLKARLEKAQARRSLRLLQILLIIYNSPAEAKDKALLKLKAAALALKRAALDRRRSTYGAAPLNEAPNRLFRCPAPAALSPHAPVYALLAQKTLGHEFNLLGSGWVRAWRGLAAARPRLLGREINRSNRGPARKLWGKISPGYIPINWNADIKSGFVWPADRPSALQKYGDQPGADIKLPWELARMQHLPWLALAAALRKAGSPGLAQGEVYALEFQNQALDFAAACPPRFGPNWVCAMDAGIRACNLLAAYDLFIDQGLSFPAWFEREFLRLLQDHFEHLSAHLEYQPGLRANHYYSDVVCLLILSAWLPISARSTAALAWAVQEFFAETRLQFQKDGSNFEASSSYHRLCGELLLYALAVIRGLSAESLRALGQADCSAWNGSGYYPIPRHAQRPEQGEHGLIIPAEVLEISARISAFTLACRMEERECLQIGDNDSGRLFKFLPSLGTGKDGSLLPEGEEMVNDHAHLLSAAQAWTEDPALAAWSGLPDGEMIRLLAQGAARRTYPKLSPPAPSSPTSPPASAWRSFPDFGLFFYYSGEDIWAVRCGHNGQRGNGGHAHNDQLSLALARSGKMILLDPGTYVYTPAPDLRNVFRATRHHNTLFLPGAEQNEFSVASLFTLRDQAAPQLLEQSERLFRARHCGFGEPHTRCLEFREAYTEVTDEIEAAGAGIALHCHPEVRVKPERGGARCLLERGGARCVLELVSGHRDAAWTIEEFFYSPAYGLKIPAPRLLSPPFSGRLIWRIY